MAIVGENYWNDNHRILLEFVTNLGLDPYFVKEIHINGSDGIGVVEFLRKEDDTRDYGPGARQDAPLKYTVIRTKNPISYDDEDSNDE